MKFLPIYSLCLLLLSSSKNSSLYHKEKKDFELKDKTKNCPFPKTTLKQFERFGFSIKSNFVLDKFKIFDLDKNGVNDSLVILSPWELKSDYDSCPKRSLDSLENRILIVNLYNQKGTILHKFKFDNIISKDISYPIYDGAEKIIIKKGYIGFVLQKSLGQGYTNEYSIFCRYDTNRHDFLLDNIVFKGNRPSENKEVHLKMNFIEEKILLKSFDKSLIEKTLENF